VPRARSSVVGLEPRRREGLLGGRVQLRVHLVEVVLDGRNDALSVLDDALAVGPVDG